MKARSRVWLGIRMVLLVLLATFALVALLAFLAPLPLVHTAVKDVHGAYHVHSKRSDGWGTPEEIAHAAKKAGLDFVVLTDHNLMELPPPSYVEGVLLVNAVELSTPWGHLVALGLDRGLNADERAKDPIDEVARRGGFTVLAHPVQNRWPWHDWVNAPRAKGFELYSGDTLFRRALEHPVTGLVPAVAAYLGRPVQGVASLLGGDQETTTRLLELSQKGGLKVALCGVDAHGYPPYASVFGTLSLHLPPTVGALPTDPRAAAKVVLDGIESGSAYCAMDGIAPAPGFAIDGLPAGKRVVSLRTQLRPRFAGGAPPSWRWEIMGPAHVAEDGVTLVTDGPGIVQAEIWIRMPGLFLIPVWRPWIVPGPFEVSATP